MGRSVHEHFRQLIGDAALKLDYTELQGLDNLSHPTECLAASQEMAAEIFGAGQTFYLVNGTTAGIHAALLATCSPDSLCLMARNAHVSAFNALQLTGCRPEYLRPEFDPRHGICHGVRGCDIQQRLQDLRERGEKVGAVFLVSPTYFGAVSDLKKICHAFDVPLIVDEAHGGHFAFHKAFPPSALSCGVDVVIQSTHKVLGSLTQSSMLHVNRTAAMSGDRIRKWLRILQSSSPSYLLMASLEAAALQLMDRQLFDQPFQAAEMATEELRELEGLQLVSDACCFSSVIGFDPLRISVNVSAWKLDGHDIAAALEARFGVVPELATTQLVIFAFGPGSRTEDAKRLVHAMHALSNAHASPAIEGTPKADPVDAFPPMRLTPCAAAHHETETVELDAALRRICGETIVTYPPGIPLVVPGECITESVLQRLQNLRERGATASGVQDATLDKIEVLV